MGWADGHGVLTRSDGGKYDGDWKESNAARQRPL